MANLFFLSDTHFTHANIIKYCNRPFASAEVMDEVMIERWNATVRPQDHVYHLGDVAITKKAIAICGRLNGHKRLITGNHDIYHTKEYSPYFEKIMGLRVIDNILFSHIPIHEGSLARFSANVHGHLHVNPSPPGRYVNICVEHTGYRPISLEEIKQQIAKLTLPLAPHKEDE